jgi:transposase
MIGYTIYSPFASIIAMDTHARTVTAKGVDLASGQVKTRRFDGCPSPAEIADWITSSFAAPHLSAYESGCTGFHLARELGRLGIECRVIAVSTVARSTDDKQGKNDKRDARRLLAELRSPDPTLSAVWVPDEECEGMRDLARAYSDATDALKRSKQQLSALLLRHGWVWNERTPAGNLKATWGKDHGRWLGTISLGSAGADEALRAYRLAVSDNEAQVARLKALLDAHAQEGRWKPYADALSMLYGVSLYSAMLYAAEFGDFSRFKNGGSVSKWVGTIPKSHASGEKTVANGHITKAGNAHVRSALVEGVQTVGRWSAAGKRPAKGQVVSERVLAECKKASRRLRDRFRHLTADQKKHPNVAKVAIANELVRWVWHIGRMVQQEQAEQQRA